MTALMHREPGRTGRAAFLRQSGEEIRSSEDANAMLFVRVRDFPELRARIGYEASDALGGVIADGIEAILRPGDSGCRVGDGEFAVFLGRLLSDNHALLAASRVQRMLREEIQLEGRHWPLDVAIGVAHAAGSTTDPEQLMRQADRASQRALSTRMPVERYVAPHPHEDIPKDALREAILGNRMQVWLQPIWDLRQRRMIGVESLARWLDSKYGLVSPGDFVPLAERTGLIGDFTRWCLNATLRHTFELRKLRPDIHVGINFSPRLFVEDDIVEQVHGALAIWNVPHDAVMLEVTEGETMQNPERSAMMLGRFHASGIAVALDDFGMGHSSFDYLRQYPVSALKIDQGFVRELGESDRARQLVRSMVDLARNLGITSIAEGVEDASTLHLLEGMGCDRVQGYHIARPQPADALLASLVGD